MRADLSKRLVGLRKERGLTQKQAAAKLGISQALLSHYEKGIRECGLDFLCTCADFYGVSTDYLLGRSDALPSTSAGESEGTKQRAQLLDAAGTLFDMYQSLGSAELTSRFSLYMSVPVYMMARRLCDAGAAVPGYSPAPDVSLPYSPMSVQLLSEAAITRLLEGADAKAVPPADAPPEKYAALRQTLESVDQSCKALQKEP